MPGPRQQDRRLDKDELVTYRYSIVLAREGGKPDLPEQNCRVRLGPTGTQSTYDCSGGKRCL